MLIETENTCHQEPPLFGGKFLSCTTELPSSMLETVNQELLDLLDLPWFFPIL